MINTPKLQFERIDETVSRTGTSKSTLYDQISKGLFPPPIKLGPRASGWLNHETDLLIAARASGMLESELILLVSELVQQRSNYLNNLRSRESPQ